MPKMKTHKASKKRFRVTASGKLKRTQAGKKHLNSHKSGKRKRQGSSTLQFCQRAPRPIRPQREEEIKSEHAWRQQLESAAAWQKGQCGGLLRFDHVESGTCG